MPKQRKDKNFTAGISPAVDDKWRARDDLRTLTQAEEIRRDGARMRAAKMEGRQQVKALDKVIKPKAKR